MKTFFGLLAAASALASLGFAVDTRTWSQNDYLDFEKGNLKKLSLSSDGRLTLAPAFRELYDSDSVYLWALAEDSRGNVYAAGGGPGGPGARLYVIPPNGAVKTLAHLDDLEIHALAIDQRDQVYAATSPDGKVYRINSAGKAEVFFDPHAKYIWGMAFDSRGNLFLATGDRGEIYKVTQAGKGDVFFATGETHARSLAIDDKDNLLVGTEPGGLVVRVSPTGQGFVLYQAPKREITAVALAKDGSVYAAAVGNKGASAPVGTPVVTPRAPQPIATGTVAPGGSAGRIVSLAPSPIPGASSTSIAGGSEVYRIDPEGFPRKVWSHPQNIAYTISFDKEGRALIGTGNKGAIYRLENDHVYTDLLNAPPTQVTCLFTGRGGKLYAATGNVGKVYQIGPGFESEGTIESEVFDAEMFSYWGRLSFRGAANGGQIAIEARSGNLDRPQKDWSPWSAAITSPDGERVQVPPARFFQWRAVLKSNSGDRSPDIRSVDVAYQTKNVAPVIEAIEVTPPNYKFPPQTLSIAPSRSLTLPPLGRQTRSAPPSLNLGSSSSSMQYAKGSLGVRWNASDENDDALVYTVQIKGERQSEWLPLKDKLNEKFLSWDSTAFPDGQYRVRVVASDAPDNPPGQALTAERVSEPFLIDNTPPQISGLSATVNGGKLNVSWRAIDALSTIVKAEYSINGGDWTVIEPTSRLSDSLSEEYALVLDRSLPGEQTIAVRVTDSFDNQTVAKTVVHSN